jgi:hypothetical protein
MNSPETWQGSRGAQKSWFGWLDLIEYSFFYLLKIVFAYFSNRIIDAWYDKAIAIW